MYLRLRYRAVRSGSKSPVVVVPPGHTFEEARLVSALGALQELYVVSDAIERLLFNCQGSQFIVNVLYCFLSVMRLILRKHCNILNDTAAWLQFRDCVRIIVISRLHM